MNTNTVSIHSLENLQHTSSSPYFNQSLWDTNMLSRIHMWVYKMPKYCTSTSPITAHDKMNSIVRRKEKTKRKQCPTVSQKQGWLWEAGQLLKYIYIHVCILILERMWAYILHTSHICQWIIISLNFLRVGFINKKFWISSCTFTSHFKDLHVL